MHHDQSTSTLLTHNTLLRGSVTLQQFRTGNRNSLEPILMAAALPLKPHQHILEIGCGNGAALLCLLARQPQLHVYGIEKDPPTSHLCQINLNTNHFNEQSTVYTGSFPQELPKLPPLDHCLANPPWYAQNNSKSPNKQRQRARHGPPDLLNHWIAGARHILKHKGVLTLILPVSSVDHAIEQLREHHFGEITLHPFWPKSGRNARIALLQSRLGVKGGMAITAGTCLHNQDGTYTQQAQHILEAPRPLTLQRH